MLPRVVRPGVAAPLFKISVLSKSTTTPAPIGRLGAKHRHKEASTPWITKRTKLTGVTPRTQGACTIDTQAVLQTHLLGQMI